MTIQQSLRSHAEAAGEGDPLAAREAMLTAAARIDFLERAWDEWQPIETAPKGRPIMLFEPEVKSGRSNLPARVVVERYPTTYPRPATHWQPLPTPPSRGEGA